MNDREQALNLQSPIILIGTHRSGTSWLFNQVFSQHPNLAGWNEPRYVWEWGNNYKPDDVLNAEDAKPQIVEHIRSRFAKFVQSEGKTRLFEKTPNNCLRLPFIHQVYPQAKIIHVVRDGRAVFSSSADMLENRFYRQDRLSDRLKEMIVESPLWGIPAYIPTIVGTIVAKLSKKPLKYWGPKPQGWQNWVKNDSKNVILAKQWVETTEQALTDSKLIPSEFYYRFRYEDLITNPRETMASITDFLNLEQGEILVDYVAETVNTSRKDLWRDSIDRETLQEIEPYLKPTLEKLGYQW